jgi:hypothetical protein
MVTNKGYKTITVKESTWKALAECGLGLNDTYDATILRLIKTSKRVIK